MTIVAISINQDLANHHRAPFGTWAAGKAAAVGGVPYAYIALGVVVLLAGAAYKLRGSELLRPRSSDLKPLRAPKMLELPELTDAAYRDSMLWGTYRSGLYFGMRTRCGAMQADSLMQAPCKRNP